MSEYVGLKQGKIHEEHIISEYYCGGCGWPVTDHDSYCSECGGELHEGMGKRMSEKKSPTEARGDCTICKGWVDDGRGGMCVFSDDYWSPNCPYERSSSYDR